MAETLSVGAVTSLCNLAWQVYKHCKDASESFKNVSSEVLSLHAVLREAEENLSQTTLSDSRFAGLTTVIIGCRDVLTDLNTLIEKYKKLDSKTQRVWHRVGWHMEDMTELRLRLVSNTGLLTAFLSSSQFAVEQKLNQLLQEFRNGYHENSIISTQTVGSISDDEKQTWRAIRKELEDIGISVDAFDSNKSFIMQWFRTALERGDFQDQLGGVESDETYQSKNSGGSSEAEIESISGSQDFADPAESGEEIHQHSQKLPRKSQVRTGGTPMNDAAKSSRNIMISTANKGKELQKTYKSTLAEDIELPKPMQTPVSRPQDSKPNNPKSLLGRLARVLLRYDNALFTACFVGDIEKARMLIEKGANVETCGKHGRYPIIDIILTGPRPYNMDTFRLLVDHGAKYERAVELAARQPDVDTLNAVFNVLDSFSPIRLVSQYYLTRALLVAARNGVLGSVELLLFRGADINGNKEERPLHCAASRLHVDVVKLLVERGANINGKSKLDQYYPYSNGLIEESPQLEKSATWIAALWVTPATLENSLKVLKLLLDHGADPNERGMMKRIAARGHIDVAKLLVKYGARPNITDLRAAREFWRRQHNDTLQALQQVTLGYLAQVIFVDQEKLKSEARERKLEKRLAAKVKRDSRLGDDPTVATYE